MVEGSNPFDPKSQFILLLFFSFFCPLPSLLKYPKPGKQPWPRIRLTMSTQQRNMVGIPPLPSDNPPAPSGPRGRGRGPVSCYLMVAYKFSEKVEMLSLSLTKGTIPINSSLFVLNLLSHYCQSTPYLSSSVRVSKRPWWVSYSNSLSFSGSFHRSATVSTRRSFVFTSSKSLFQLVFKPPFNTKQHWTNLQRVFNFGVTLRNLSIGH